MLQLVGFLLLGAVLADVAPRGCADDATKKLPFCDPSLSMEARVDDLVSRLTLEEKISQITPDPKFDHCTMLIQGIPRLGIPEYMWLTETNTQANSPCYGPDKCATSFNGPLGMGASFNRTSWRLKGVVVGDELRAMHNVNWKRFGWANFGLTGFGPNINIVIDPRFGRNSELPGEDPFLSGTYAVEYTQGMQEIDENGFYKIRTYLKHYAAYNVETNRGHDDYKISLYDFFDTHLPQYEMAMVGAGGSSGVMCSYNAENGNPSCANSWLLNDVLRKRWNRPDAFVFTDCGAVSNLRGAPVNANSDAKAAAYALMNGTDAEAGSTLFPALKDAIKQNLATEEAVTEAARRSFLQRFRAGIFDDPSRVKWTSIGVEVINSTRNQQIAFEAGLQSMVLLKNDGILPLKKNTKIAVVGPQAVQRYGLLSDYFGDEVCWSGQVLPSKQTYNCISTIGEAIANINGWDNTRIAEGVSILGDSSEGVGPAFGAVASADLVVLVLGHDKSVEYEGHDRPTMALAGKQEWFAKEVLKYNKPTVLILVNGGQVAIESLVPQSKAIIEAFNPGVVGSRGLAAQMFGLYNKWGKLPVTLYPLSFEKQFKLADLSVSTGRTYRYYNGEATFPFGFGLSLTEFKLDSCVQLLRTDSALKFSCIVKNIGSLVGDEVVMVFHEAGDDIKGHVGNTHPIPIRKLIQFERITIGAGEQANVELEIPLESLKLVNQNGDRVLYSGNHELVFSRGHTDNELRVIVAVDVE